MSVRHEINGQSAPRTAEDLAAEAETARILSQPTAGLSDRVDSAGTPPQGFSEPTHLTAEGLQAEQDTAERLADSDGPRS